MVPLEDEGEWEGLEEIELWPGKAEGQTVVDEFDGYQQQATEAPYIQVLSSQCGKLIRLRAVTVCSPFQCLSS